MEKEEIAYLVQVRSSLVKKFESLRDYKNNKNAIMKEVDHAKVIHDTIVQLDSLLKEHVNFAKT